MPRRERSANQSYPFSIRLTRAERTELERLAGGEPLGAFARAQLLSGKVQPRRTRGKAPVRDHKALAQLLGKLGQSRLASNLNQLARAAHSGSLPLTPETEQALQAAYREILAMKQLLMQALGIEER